MVDSFAIKGVPSYTQMNNAYAPALSCFPTSLAMVMRYCLNKKGLKKKAVGCGEATQLEDYINLLMDDDETAQWMRDNSVRYGSWILAFLRKRRQREVFCVEEYAFNRLMKRNGFKATMKTDMTYDDFCGTMYETRLPVILSGDFSDVSKVGGHMVCAVGYNRIGLKQVAVNDPYGNAMKGYRTGEFRGEGLQYPVKYFIKNGQGHMYGLIIEKHKPA